MLKHPPAVPTTFTTLTTIITFTTLITYMHKLRNYALSSLLCAALLINLNVFAQGIPQKKPDPPKNWHQMDLKTDGFYGVSLKQAYQFLKGKKSKTVVVTTINSGIDTNQTDLKNILWVNPKEIP